MTLPRTSSMRRPESPQIDEEFAVISDVVTRLKYSEPTAPGRRPESEEYCRKVECFAKRYQRVRGNTRMAIQCRQCVSAGLAATHCMRRQ